MKRFFIAAMLGVFCLVAAAEEMESDNEIQSVLVKPRDLEAVDFLKTVIGKTVYKGLSTELYPSSIPLYSLVNPRENYKFKPVSILDVRNLTPLKIISWKYFPDEGRSTLNVELPNKEIMVLVGMFASLHDPARKELRDRLSELGIFVDEEIPKRFTKKEIQAIDNMEFFIGMSQEAVSYALGRPEKTNDYGRAGMQLIYDDHHLLIYTKGYKVVDYQRIGR